MSDEEQADADVDPADETSEASETDASEDAQEADEVTEDAEDAAQETDGAGEESDDAGFQPSDFVELEYTVRTVPEDDEEGRVVDTTSEEVADEAGIDDEEYDFEPRTIQIGEGHVFDSVDTDLQGKTVGASDTVTVPPSEAFGEFDPDDVRTVAADKIPEDDRYPGAQVTVDGEQGYVETIVGGRARVDFNHPLAGDTLEYDYEVVDEVTGEEDQARATLGMYLQEAPEVRIEEETIEREVPTERIEDEETGEVHEETTTEEIERRTLYITATPMMQMNQQWMFSKQQIATQLMDQLGLDRVVVEEVIDGSGGMGGMMGGMGMGGMGGGADLGDDDEEIDVDAEELVEELEDA